MNVLIIGSGGREHALALKVAESGLLDKLFAIPGNPGIEQVAECHYLDIMDNDAIINFVKEKNIGLVIIGPEAPLVNGLADELGKKGINAFGPNKVAAQFEGSKAFSRNFMKKYNLPSVEFQEFTNSEDAEKYIIEKGAPIVVKADGLAAGKGVLVAKTIGEAVSFAKDCLENNKFGDASSKVIVEECLIGEEASYLVFMDSETFKPMVYSQDHKPIFEGDQGPNTGGMGAYSPAPILDGLETEMEEKIMRPFIAGIKQEGIEYKGVLYVGLMKTKEGLKILEFNCRFGDPETQVILPRLKTDILEVMNAVVNKKLDSINIEWSDEHCVSVVLASGGYPNAYEKGKLITGLENIKDAQVIHAGTKKEGGKIFTNGGRVLNIVCLGKNLQEAVDKAYSTIKGINFDGMFFRRDIAKKELDRRDGGMKMPKEEEYKKIIKKNLNNTLDFGFLPELGKHKSGKVREIHFTSDKIGSSIIMVASDRVSAFDYVLDKSIPFKGRVLNLLNQWAFQNSGDIIPNASVDSPHPNVVIQRYYKNIMIECVVRGYVWGSLASAYEKGKRNFCGLEMPNDLLRYQKLETPLFTPTTKSEHDEPMTFAEVEAKIGKELAAKVKDTSLKLFKRGAKLAAKAGLIFIDTKYEFGLDEQDHLFLIDESNTPDSSRYCSIEEHKKFDLIKQEMATGQYKNVSELLKQKPELKIKEMSKQFIRDVLTEKGFSYGGTGEIPKLTDEDVVEVSYRYINLYEQLTGNTFEFPTAPPKVELLNNLQQAGLINSGLAVIIAGSDSDMPHIEKIQAALNDFGVKSQVRICSAHKQPGLCESIVKKYNKSLEPIVIIAVAGGTDALSGVASFHSIFPVVSCPPKAEEYHSGISNPPGSSNSLILRPANAGRHAAQILSFHNENIKKVILDKNATKIKKLEAVDNSL